MTEKRFVIPKGLRVIRNTETGEEALFYDTEDGLLLEKWLNEQHQENQALKSDRVRYEEECRLDVFRELYDENEQLKKDLKIIVEHRKQENEYTARLEEKNEQLRLDNGRLLSDYVDVCNENVALEKENEQLRKELENNIASYKKCNRRVFDLIDNKINEVDTIGAEVLKDLRRELME